MRRQFYFIAHNVLQIAASSGIRSTNLNRRSKPFLFKFFAGWLKLFSLIINELGNTFKNSSKIIWISQNKSSIFVSSKQLSGDIKTKIK